MNTSLPVDTNPVSYSRRSAIILSALLHVGIIVIGVVGLPYIKKPVLPPQPISVEIVEIDEISQTNKRSATKPIEEKKKDIPKKEDKPPVAPKVEAVEPPKPIPVKEKVEEKKIVKPKPVPPPPEKVLKKPEPEPKKEEEEPQVAQQEQFLSVLKNLQDGAPEEAVEKAEVETVSEEKSPLAQFSDRVSQSEMDAMQAALNRQFSYCWNLAAGAQYAEDIVVEIRLLINPDRTIKDARIVDQWRYNQDSFFRAAADNVLRAINHPSCEVLDLPPDRYEFYKDAVFNFNPSQML